jgi:hypothetical protein
VKTRKSVLVVTDGTPQTHSLAEQIGTELSSCSVVVLKASEFAGTDILPVDAFFLGCETPEPSSFAYLSELLRHISLAGRSCGVFSSESDGAVKYLAGLVKDCEARFAGSYVARGRTGEDLKRWIKAVVQ